MLALGPAPLGESARSRRFPVRAKETPNRLRPDSAERSRIAPRLLRLEDATCESPDVVRALAHCSKGLPGLIVAAGSAGINDAYEVRCMIGATRDRRL